MDEGGLDEAELLGIETALAEVGILIDGAGNEAWDLGYLFFVRPKDEGE